MLSLSLSPSSSSSSSSYTQVDVNIVDKLMMYPEVKIDPFNLDENVRSHLLAEYKRFKNVQVIGVDALTKGK